MSQQDMPDPTKLSPRLRACYVALLGLTTAAVDGDGWALLPYESMKAAIVAADDSYGQGKGKASTAANQLSKSGLIKRDDSDLNPKIYVRVLPSEEATTPQPDGSEGSSDVVDDTATGADTSDGAPTDAGAEVEAPSHSEPAAPVDDAVDFEASREVERHANLAALDRVAHAVRDYSDLLARYLQLEAANRDLLRDNTRLMAEQEERARRDAELAEGFRAIQDVVARYQPSATPTADPDATNDGGVTDPGSNGEQTV